jgi:hypothetical protein
VNWDYTLRPRSGVVLDVLENGRRLLSVFHPPTYGAGWKVSGGPFKECTIDFDPFTIRCAGPWSLFQDPLPVFVYQERPL